MRPRGDATPWDHALARREELVAVVNSVLAQENVSALVLRSQNGIYPPWVRLEAWIPDRKTGGASRQLSELNLIVDAAPCHEHVVVTTAKLKRGRIAIEVGKRPDFTDEDCAEWVRYALDLGHKPSSYRPWRDAFWTVVGRFIPPLQPHRNRISKALKSRFWASNGPVLAGGMVLWLMVSVLMPIAPMLGMLALLALIAGGIYVAFDRRRRRHTVAVMPQPVVSPRSLALVDSWHVLVSGLGQDADILRQRLLACFENARPIGIETAVETEGYRTPNGYEERERITLTKGQSIVHVLIHPYLPDLFVGWHAQLNWAKWGEYLTGVTKDEGGRQIAFHELRPSIYQPNLFDLMDLNGLSDFVHRHFEIELKRLLKERAIDQEIDFEIVRGDRGLALSSDRHAKKDEGQDGSQRWSNIMSRAREWQQTSITEKYMSAETGGGVATKSSAPASRSSSGLLAALLLPAIALGIGFIVRAIDPNLLRYIAPAPIALGIGLWLFARVEPLMAVAAAVLSVALGIILSLVVSALVSAFQFDSMTLMLLHFAVQPLSLLAAGAYFAPSLRGVRFWVLVTGIYAIISYIGFENARDFGYTSSMFVVLLSLGLFVEMAMIGWRLGRNQDSI